MKKEIGDIETSVEFAESLRYRLDVLCGDKSVSGRASAMAPPPTYVGSTATAPLAALP